MRPSKPRITPLEESEWDQEIQPLMQSMKAFGGGRVYNIFSTVAHHPKLLKKWLVFGTHVLNKSTLPARERELVILRVGWLCRAEYEWAQHVLIGKQCGVSDEEIQRITKGPEAAGWNDLDNLLLRATDELHSNQCITDATWKGLIKRLETKQLMDLLFTVGQYTLISMVLNSLGVALDPGLSGFPE